MRHLINIINESLLNEGQNYEAMFNKYTQAYPECRPLIQNEVKWAKQHLKKNDRIVCYLKSVRSMIDYSLDKIEKEGGDNKYEHALAEIKTILGTFTTKRDIEHYLSLNIPAIDNYVWPANLPVSSILEIFKKHEDEWKAQANELVKIDPEDKVYMSFPDGFAWVILDRAGCRAEGNAMGHCGNMPSMKQGQRILSLRKKVKQGPMEFWRPSLTFILNKDGNLGEMKGRANNKPDAKYHPHIIALLKSDIIKGIRGGGYAPEENFDIDDLDETVRNQLLEQKPELETGYVKLENAQDISEALNFIFNEHKILVNPENEDEVIIHNTVDVSDLNDDSDMGYVLKVFSGDEFYDSAAEDDQVYDFIDALNGDIRKKIAENILKHHAELVAEWEDEEDNDFGHNYIREFIEWTRDNHNESDIEELFDAASKAVQYGISSGAEGEMMDSLKAAVKNIDTDDHILPVPAHGRIVDYSDSNEPRVTVVVRASEILKTPRYIQNIKDAHREVAQDDYYARELADWIKLDFESPPYGWDGFDDSHALETFQEDAPSKYLA